MVSRYKGFRKHRKKIKKSGENSFENCKFCNSRESFEIPEKDLQLLYNLSNLQRNVGQKLKVFKHQYIYKGSAVALLLYSGEFYTNANNKVISNSYFQKIFIMYQKTLYCTEENFHSNFFRNLAQGRNLRKYFSTKCIF